MSEAILGIDISKKELVVALLIDSQPLCIANAELEITA